MALVTSPNSNRLNENYNISIDFDNTDQETTSSNQNPTPVYIGSAIFDKKHQLVRKSKREFDHMYGHIKEKFLDDVTPNDIMTFESKDCKVKILSRLEEMKSNNFSGGAFGQSFHVLGTTCKFRPIIEIENDNVKEEIQQRDLSGFKIRKSTKEEYQLLSGLPTSGLPIGNQYTKEYELDAFYPYDPFVRNLDSSIFQSFFVTGVQGYGKSNGIKFLEQVMIGNSKIPKNKRPSIINLDAEFSFTYFSKKEYLEKKTQQFFEKHGIEDVDVDVLTISKDPKIAGATLSLEALSPEAFLYMMPELDPKTEGRALHILELAYHIIEQDGLDRTIENVRNTSLNLISNNGLIHPLQKPALNRAFFSVELDLFDQPNKKKITPEMLFQPGKITTLNVNGLDKNRRRVVALYLLELANHFKVENNNPEPGLIITLDECEQITPAYPTKREKTHVDRCVERMETITELGRKRSYGLIVVSHEPSAISKRITNLANTTIVYRSAGSDEFIAKKLGREYVEESRNLSKGVSLWRINIAGLNSSNPVSKIQTMNMDDVRTLDQVD